MNNQKLAEAIALLLDPDNKYGKDMVDPHEEAIFNAVLHWHSKEVK